MITIKGIGRKIIASIFSSLIVALFILFFAYDYPEVSNFIFIFSYSTFYCLIIGAPCSIVTDLVIYKIKGAFYYYILGFALHLMFAGIVVYLFTLADDTVSYDGFVIYMVFAIAAALWLVDNVLKNLKKLFNIK